MSPRLARLLSSHATLAAGLLLAAFVLLEVGSLRRMTLTKEENAHYRYGWQILNFNSKRFNNSEMPFSALNALPRKVASVLGPGPPRWHLETVWDRTKAYRILVDSNLGWSQNKWYVERYLRRHPDALFEPDGPQAGTIVVSVNKYVGMWAPERYRWLRENFEPVGHIAHGHLILRVTPEALLRVTDPLPADSGDKGN
jgi:hypothetical protein